MNKAFDQAMQLPKMTGPIIGDKQADHFNIISDPEMHFQLNGTMIMYEEMVNISHK